MKKIKILSSMLLLCLFSLSCDTGISGDEISVRYQIVGLDNSVVNIQYRNSDNVIENTDYNAFGNGQDNRTIAVSRQFLPFEAKLQITANNTTDQEKEFTLVIFVNGAPADYTEMSVPAAQTATNNVAFTVE